VGATGDAPVANHIYSPTASTISASWSNGLLDPSS
jgi:hypothetical protein